jgi:aminoglycoside/choline kinase family phosphotransferase
MAEMTRLTFEALPGADTLWRELRAALIAQLSAISGTSVLSLRDVHGDNLMWRPGEAGLARIGLLDFQDALLLPDGYDLASLLDDPRREVPETWRRDLVAAYAAARGVNVEEMAFRTDLLSLQRNLRVLGIFRRLAVERGRPSYARFIPRTRTLLARAAGHPQLAALGPLVLDLLARTAQWPEAAA